MTHHRMIRAGVAAGLAASFAGGLALAAAAQEGRAAAPSTLDFGTAGDGSAAGTIEVQSFSWGVSQTPSTIKGRAAAPSSSSSCPASTDAARWKAPELASTRDRSAAPPSLPPGVACVYVVTAREAGSGMATGRKGWDGCVKGNHIAKATIVHRDLAYRLTNAEVVECAADGVVLSFQSASVAPAPAGVKHEYH